MLTKADFTSSQEVRWCPGCGDYSILATMQRVLPELNIPKENIVFISGIGCSGRFPYYMNTYGFHTIHGRAPAIASGLKLANPNLSVWVITGDGDGLSIGANHLMHLLRRNFDVKVLLFNNRIYGLTKGQYSPTSEQGKITSTTPLGSLDRPINPIGLALALDTTFVARGLDIDSKGLQEIFTAAAAHRGSAFIEIYQNCNIFNDKAFEHLSDKSVREDRILWLEKNKPLIFGKAKERGLAIEQFKPVVTDASAKNVVTYDGDIALAQLLSRLDYPEFPVPMGIFRSVVKPTYEELLKNRATIHDNSVDALNNILRSGHVWEVN